MEYNKLTDIELIERITGYDKEALTELYDRYSGLLFTLIKKIVSDEKIAGTILIEVFTIIFKKAKYFDFSSDNPYVWIVSIARNRAVDSLRRNRSSAATKEFYNSSYEDAYILPLISPEIDGLDIETANNISSSIESAYNRLTEIQRHVINLAYFEGYTINEITKSLNLPIETVRTKIMTSIFSLRDKLMEK